MQRPPTVLRARSSSTIGGNVRSDGLPDQLAPKCLIRALPAIAIRSGTRAPNCERRTPDDRLRPKSAERRFRASLIRRSVEPGAPSPAARIRSRRASSSRCPGAAGPAGRPAGCLRVPLRGRRRFLIRPSAALGGGCSRVLTWSFVDGRGCAPSCVTFAKALFSLCDVMGGGVSRPL
jgi:hypothetical protein